MMTRGRGIWIPPKNVDVIYEQPLFPEKPCLKQFFFCRDKMRLQPLVLLAVHTIADPHQLQRARRSGDQSGALHVYGDGDHDEDCEDRMMILTFFNQLVEPLTSLVHDLKLVHLYVEDKKALPGAPQSRDATTTPFTTTPTVKSFLSILETLLFATTRSKMLQRTRCNLPAKV